MRYDVVRVGDRLDAGGVGLVVVAVVRPLVSGAAVRVAFEAFGVLVWVLC